MKKSFLILILICSSTQIFAEDFWNSNYKLAYQASLRLKFHEVDSLLNIENGSNMVCESYIKAHSFFTKYYLNYYSDDVIQNADSISYHIDIVENNEIDNPWFYYIKAEMQSMNSILLATQKNNFKSVLNIYKSNKLLKKKIEEYPEFEAFKNLYGMQLCAFSGIPEDYKSIASFFGIKGDVELGINYLKESSYSNNSKLSFIRDKFKFAYLFCEIEFNKNEKINTSEILSNYKEYPFLVYYQANKFHRSGELENAISLLDETEKSWTKNFNYLNYYTGRLLSFKMAPSANLYLNKFLKQSENKKFRASTYKYLAYNNKLKNNDEAYLKYIDKLNKLDYKKLADSDQAAIDEANVLKNILFIRAQYLYDATKYEESLITLKELDKDEICTVNIECLIYNYKLASIYNEQKNHDLALKHYLKCTNIKYDSRLHYQANSYLKIAELYYENEKYTYALNYIDKCLELNDYHFKYFIQSNAKGLKRKIKEKES